MNQEVLYHVFLRSFYDSNGDRYGDFVGLQEKLDYIQDLGFTTILVSPIVKSGFYHNYFADDFEEIDSDYGTRKEWLILVEAIHDKGMKIYLDQEFQYVTDRQLWFRDSYENPDSQYSQHLIYKGEGNTDPESGIYNLTSITGFDGRVRKIATVNLHHPEVKAYYYRLLSYWMDPQGDRSLKGGVDGFRLDHMMDHLDQKEDLKDLFRKFWFPLLESLRVLNPTVKFIAEQGDWSKRGVRYFEEAGADGVFAFKLREAIVSFDKQQLEIEAESILGIKEEMSRHVVFIENHDLIRFASLSNQDLRKLKVGAALNLFLGGTPSIYYGQEIGMSGYPIENKGTDANDIPHRQAFKWFLSDEEKGMASWYKSYPPWSDEHWEDANKNIVLAEEQVDPDSIWNFYKELLRLRRKYKALTEGAYATAYNNNSQVFSFIRFTNETSRILVLINLSEESQYLEVDDKKINPVQLQPEMQVLLSGEQWMATSMLFNLRPYEVVALKLLDQEP